MKLETYHNLSQGLDRQSEYKLENADILLAEEMELVKEQITALTADIKSKDWAAVLDTLTLLNMPALKQLDDASGANLRKALSQINRQLVNITDEDNPRLSIDIKEYADKIKDILTDSFSAPCC
ncbi:TPA: hypothetical protein DCZ15_01820 [Candidatus Falkowbacteria bacterium]|nr:MAG: hypothetical protein UV95_C0004G0026 [Candidatus Falkowbacteria bacterium GW2011_GWF2_43_32]HBA36592.1 hypothetical protein [Candidatus Falkowbacteria bacterium]